MLMRAGWTQVIGSTQLMDYKKAWTTVSLSTSLGSVEVEYSPLAQCMQELSQQVHRMIDIKYQDSTFCIFSPLKGSTDTGCHVYSTHWSVPQLERGAMCAAKWTNHWLCCEVLCNLWLWQKCAAEQVSSDNRYHHWWPHSNHWICFPSGCSQCQRKRSIYWTHHAGR